MFSRTGLVILVELFTGAILSKSVFSYQLIDDPSGGSQHTGILYTRQCEPRYGVE